MNFFARNSIFFMLLSAMTCMYANENNTLCSELREELSVYLRYSYDDLVQSMQEQPEMDQINQETLSLIIRHVLNMSSMFYLSLTDQEQEDLITMCFDLLSLRTMIETYCDSCLKYNSVMMKYKAFRGIETMCFNMSIGIGRNDEEIMPSNERSFTMETMLSDARVQEFYDSLSYNEQQQFEEVIESMEQFRIAFIEAITMIQVRYETLSVKMQDILRDIGCELQLSMNFDELFPISTVTLL